MADVPPSEIGQLTADEVAAKGADAFSAAARSEDIARNVWWGLRCVLHVALTRDMESISRSVAQRLAEDIVKAGFALAVWLDGKFPIESAQTGMVSALALAEFFGKDRAEIPEPTSVKLLDFEEHVKILISELQISMLKSAIAERGNNLTNDLANYRRFVNHPLNPDTAIH